MASVTIEVDHEDDEEEMLLLMYLLRRRQQQRHKQKMYWVHPILSRRKELGEFYQLIQELKLHPNRFHTYFRMNLEQFSELLEIVGPCIRRKYSPFREAICPEQRLAITLRFLSTGDTYTTIAFSFRVGCSTVAEIVEETCDMLWKCLVDEYMPIPKEEDWNDVAKGFQQAWNFPNCLGALDGKHVMIQAPPNSGSVVYYNYKMTFSMVLLALVDANYRFVVIDVGSYGSSSDGGILAQSKLGKGLCKGNLNIPPATCLPGAVELGPQPHVIVGDEAFPLKTYLLRPYPGHNLTEDKSVFNYRLSRARRISENAFALLTNRWRVYQRRIQVHPERVLKVIKATCILHNFLQKKINVEDVQTESNGFPQIIPQDTPANCLQEINHFGGNRPNKEATTVRDTYKDYFSSSAGEVPWQYAIVRRGCNDTDKI